MTDDDAKKDHGNPCHARIVLAPENGQIGLLQAGKVFVGNQRPINCSACIIRHIMHNVPVNGHLGQIRKRQVERCNGHGQNNGKHKEAPVRANIAKEPLRQSQVIRLAKVVLFKVSVVGSHLVLTLIQSVAADTCCCKTREPSSALRVRRARLFDRL